MKSTWRAHGIGIGAVSLILLAAACSSSDDAPPPLTGAGNQPVAEVDPVTGTVGFYMPSDAQPALQPGADPAQAAIDYLQANGSALGIPDAKGSYVPISSSKDDTDNTTHVKLQQVAGGIVVWGIVTVVHFDDGGFVDVVDGPFIPGLDAIAKQVPAISDVTGRATAETEALTLADDTALGAIIETAELVIYVDDDYANPRLARHYLMTVWTADSAQTGEVFVDAMNGAILDSWNGSSNAEEQRSATAKGYDGLDHVTPVFEDSGTFYHGRIKTSSQSQLIPGRWTNEGKKQTWTDFTSTTVDGPWDVQAVTALLNVDRTERFYVDALKYEGPSGNRSNVWVAVRDPYLNHVNSFAYWSPNHTQDTLTFTKASPTEKSPVIGIDVVGHEFTHLVTAYNSGLLYRTEPGAINEAMSDIFGCFVERKIQGVNADTYLIGEAKGKPWRDMRHPTKGGYCTTCVDNYKDVHRLAKGTKPNNNGKSKAYNDSGFVHSNSSIVNNAWALMVDGGTNDTSQLLVKSGFGWDKSIAWWWKTQRHVATPRMGIQRLARVQSALAKKSKTRFDPEVVACAWSAVGGVSVDWAKQRLGVACTQGVVAGDGSSGTIGPDVCDTKKDGTYCSETADLFGYVCKNHAIADSLICPPPNTHCTGPSPDGKSLVCTP